MTSPMPLSFLSRNRVANVLKDHSYGYHRRLLR